MENDRAGVKDLYSMKCVGRASAGPYDVLNQEERVIAAKTDHLSPLQFPELEILVGFTAWRSLVSPWGPTRRFRDQFVDQVRHRLTSAGVNATEIVEYVKRVEDMFELKLASIAAESVRAGLDIITFVQLKAQGELGARMALKVTSIEVTASEDEKLSRRSSSRKS